MKISGRGWIGLTLLAALAALLLMSAPASAAPLVGKDGKIHACYKWKGKKKGTLRVVRGGKVRCWRKWKKVSWYARAPIALPAAVGPPGPPGPQGVPGTAGNVVVEQLESKVDELLAKVEALESVLNGMTNADLKLAAASTPVLCSQVSTLTGRVNDVEEAFGGLKLNAVLTTLGGVLEVPTLPGALPAFSCPTP